MFSSITNSKTNEGNIFVTGGTGLIGAHLLYELVKKGESVVALRRNSSNIEKVRTIFRYYDEQADSLFDTIQWYTGDLLEPESLYKAFKGIKQAYHCAAMVSLHPKEAASMEKANVEGTTKIVELCLENDVEKLCFVSSAAAIGRPAQVTEAWLDETTPWEKSDELSHYALSKYAAEQEVWKGIKRGLKAVIVNPTIVLGPGDWERSSSKLFHAIWNGLRFYSTGINSFVDVRDVAKVMVELTNGKYLGERFIATSESVSYKRLFDLIAEKLKKRKPSIKLTKAMGGIAWRAAATMSYISGKAPGITKASIIAAMKQYHFSNEKVKNALGYDFIQVEQSVTDTCEIFLRERMSNS